jgi:hypothetical protein
MLKLQVYGDMSVMLHRKQIPTSTTIIGYFFDYILLTITSMKRFTRLILNAKYFNSAFNKRESN